MSFTNTHFQQWDEQTNIPTSAHIQLSNLYLAVERGDQFLDTETRNRLSRLLSTVYPPFADNGMMRRYWLSEFENLPGWN